MTSTLPDRPLETPATGGPDHDATHPGLPTPPPEGGAFWQPRPPRRPGWRGVAGVAVGAALLSSLLTAGATTLLEDRSTTAATTVAAAPSTSAGSSGAARSTTGQPNWTAVAAAVAPSVVTVAVQDGEGSGVVLDTQGHILTNNHVIAGAGNGGITVTLSDGRTYSASVVGTDPTTDLAVIKLATVPSGLTAASFGDSTAVKVGDAVMAIGNPLGLSDTVTTGIVSAVNRPVTTTASEPGSQSDPFGSGGGLGGGLGGGGSATAQQVITNAIQTDAAINPGNSGGALVNASGQVVGITSSIASLSGSGSGQSGSIGLGFAIPASEAQNVARQLISTGTVKHAYLGVGLKDAAVTVNGSQRIAAVVQSVASGTPASASGLATGDAIIAVDGTAVDGSEGLIGTVRALSPGQKVTLTVVHDGSTRQVAVTLATAPTTSS